MSRGNSRFAMCKCRPTRFFGSLDESADADATFTEASPYSPRSPYAASKAAADHFVEAYHATYKLPTVVAICSNNYGPYQFPEKLIPLTIRRALTVQPIDLYGDGCQVRDWLHVSDCARAIRLLLERGRAGQRYNIGGGQQQTNRDVVGLLCEVIDRIVPADFPSRELIRNVTDRPGHDFRYALDTTKVRSEFDWQPTTEFTEGIEATVMWYLENEKWVGESLKRAGYDGGRLGDAE